MIVNGIDIIEINRIKKSAQNPDFVKRVFSDEEREYLKTLKNPYPSMAAMFCAKEAFSKAIGKGISIFSLNEVTVSHDMLGKPFFKLSGRAKEIAQKMKLTLSLSISHNKDTAVAIVNGEGETMYKTVIFDLDGTLLDTMPGVIVCGKYALEKLGMEKITAEQARNFLGPPLAESFPKFFGVPSDRVDEAIEFFREKYTSQQYNAKVYDGIIPLLEFLRERGTKIAVATLKHDSFAQGVLEHFGIAKYFDIICGASTEAESKKEVLINRILNEFNNTPEDAVMIGDTYFDAKGAQNAGIDFIAVTYGFMKAGEFDNFSPVAVCDTPKEIAYYV